MTDDGTLEKDGSAKNIWELFRRNSVDKVSYILFCVNLRVFMNINVKSARVLGLFDIINNNKIYRKTFPQHSTNAHNI